MSTPLTADYVGNLNDLAKLALADVKTRRRWPHSAGGSPATVNRLCAEIARLNMERDAALAALGRCADKLEKCAFHGGTTAEFAALAVKEFRDLAKGTKP